VLRQTLTSLLGSGRYTDPDSFMVGAKATVDGLMTGKLNALGLLLTGRELNGGGSLGLSAESAAKFAGHPDVAKLLKQMPFQPDLEGAAFLIRAGDLFMTLSRIQATLAADDSQSGRKPVKLRRGNPDP
jgi:hypothetical protein